MRAFNQRPFSVAQHLLDAYFGIGDVGAQVFSGAFEVGDHHLGIERRLAVEANENLVVLGNRIGDDLAEAIRLDEIGNTDTATRDLVGVGRAIASPGGADFARFPMLLFEAVDDRMVGHNHVRALADQQLVGLDSTRLQVGELANQGGRIDDDSGADDGDALRIENARGNEVQLERAGLCHHGVAGVAAAVGSDDEVALAGQGVSQFAFAFIAPLAAHDNCCRHRRTFLPVRCEISLVVGGCPLVPGRNEPQ